MATHYIKTIADGLLVFDENRNSRQFYMDLAWEGLNHSNIIAWTSLNSQERFRVEKIIKNYISGNINEECNE